MIQQDKDNLILEERGQIYGDFEKSLTNIGLAWTALLQQHYGITLPSIIPPEIVSLMMVAMKTQRSVLVYHQDNFTDLRNYAAEAERIQKANLEHPF